MNTTNEIAKTQYTVERTGETVTLRNEFTDQKTLPVVRIVATHRVSEMDSFDGVAELDGEYYYAPDIGPERYWCADWTLPNGESWQQYSPLVLYREAHSYLVGGDDVYYYETRTAPESTCGICAEPRGASKGYGEELFIVRPNLSTKLVEIEAKRAATKLAEERYAKWRSDHAAWQVAFETGDRELVRPAHERECRAGLLACEALAAAGMGPDTQEECRDLLQAAYGTTHAFEREPSVVTRCRERWLRR